ncbi:MAG: LuxR C-terminal-related transcriptional regulator, partial [Bacteroidota bacterium]|nr:LuxR C-terminal-related transcriptional regulator [Bacteroidota bacterium]
LSEQGFFKKLKEKYPDLTNNDLRLCSYLRMNFSTKEIARLLNISTRGVEISRYRIRRKFQLSHDVNLTEFLMNEMADS